MTNFDTQEKKRNFAHKYFNYGCKYNSALCMACRHHPQV